MIIVKPFEGNDYRKPNPPHGLKILVIGESSCRDKNSRGESLPLDWNEKIICSVCLGKPDPTITNAADLFYDSPLTFPAGHCAFWRSAAFANFIQHDLGNKKFRPTSAQWKAGWEPFEKYLIDLQPQFVLILGKGVWDSLPFRYRREHLSITLDADSKSQPYCLYPNDSGYAFVFAIHHPSYWNRKKRTARDYRPWVKAALDAARKFHYPQP